ncbi:hypothetical protein DFH06DRAFT_1130094 [Mycena polygramma]|nr:hypothetical protein DFH06DRAFT_1130094 [Mycena polygramma]
MTIDLYIAVHVGMVLFVRSYAQIRVRQRWFLDNRNDLHGISMNANGKWEERSRKTSTLSFTKTPGYSLIEPLYVPDNQSTVKIHIYYWRSGGKRAERTRTFLHPLLLLATGLASQQWTVPLSASQDLDAHRFFQPAKRGNAHDRTTRSGRAATNNAQMHIPSPEVRRARAGVRDAVAGVLMTRGLTQESDARTHTGPRGILYRIQ